MTGARRQSYRVTGEAQGERLDVFLASQNLGLSRSRLKRLIDEEGVWLNDAPAKPSSRLRAGDQVRVEIPPPEPARALPEPIPVPILYEDEHVIVVVKPAGMAVHPAAGVRSGTLVNALLAHCAELAGVGGAMRPGIVHRLDKGTTGVMVVAKTDLAQVRLAAQFKAHTVGRRYLALVCGRVEPARGTIETFFGRHPTARTRFSSRVREGRRAVTHYEVLERFPGMTLLALRLETGRTHQVRVHLSDRGHPVVGDPVYGRGKLGPEVGEPVRRAVQGIARQMLHAAHLAFDHPATGERIELSADLPEDFASLLSAVRAGSRR